MDAPIAPVQTAALKNNIKQNVLDFFVVYGWPLVHLQSSLDLTLPYYWKQFSKANKWGMGTEKREIEVFFTFV